MTKEMMWRMARNAAIRNDYLIESWELNQYARALFAALLWGENINNSKKKVLSKSNNIDAKKVKAMIKKARNKSNL